MGWCVFLAGGLHSFFSPSKKKKESNKQFRHPFGSPCKSSQKGVCAKTHQKGGRRLKEGLFTSSKLFQGYHGTHTCAPWLRGSSRNSGRPKQYVLFLWLPFQTSPNFWNGPIRTNRGDALDWLSRMLATDTAAKPSPTSALGVRNAQMEIEVLNNPPRAKNKSKVPHFATPPRNKQKRHSPPPPPKNKNFTTPAPTPISPKAPCRWPAASPAAPPSDPRPPGPWWTPTAGPGRWPPSPPASSPGCKYP